MDKTNAIHAIKLKEEFFEGLGEIAVVNGI